MRAPKRPEVSSVPDCNRLPSGQVRGGGQKGQRRSTLRAAREGPSGSRALPGGDPRGRPPP
eukprot:10122673-Alexandrium_andersonii.AAC.1